MQVLGVHVGDEGNKTGELAAEGVGYAVGSEPIANRWNWEFHDLFFRIWLVIDAGEKVEQSHVPASSGGGVGLDVDTAVGTEFAHVLVSGQRAALAAQILGGAEDVGSVEIGYGFDVPAGPTAHVAEAGGEQSPR